MGSWFIQRVPTPEFKGFFPFSSSPSSSICFFNLQMEMVSASRTESGLKSSLLASVKPSNRSRKSLGIVEAYKVLLKGRDGLRAAAGFSKGLNYSLDLVEWAGSESMGAVPVQVLWSSTWSQVWIEEGRRVADAVPRAKFDTHSGGRRPQKVGKQKQLHQREVS